MNENKIALNKAILWILVSTLFISGSAFMGWLYYLHVRERRFNDDQYRIVALVQSSSHADHLKTVYLAEILELSVDRPINLYQFNAKESAQTLLNNPLIKAAEIKKLLPGTLYIRYQMRTPCAYIGDFTNTVIDEEKYLFPFRPFFTPKRLPTLYLGLNKEECQWGSHLKHLSSIKLAFDLLSQFERLQQDQFFLKQVDVSQAFADSYGQRQIIMELEENHAQASSEGAPLVVFLRLSLDHAQQDLMNFYTLQKTFFEKKKEARLKKESVIFDFRIPHLAFINSSD